jgi:ATP phosphoribosyltransferase
VTNPLTIAMPKGRLLEPAVALFGLLGYDCPLNNNSRQLRVEDPAGRVQFLLAKAGDVAVYVEYGAADLGIVGQDVLRESGCDVYEPLPLGFGRCRLVLAGARSALAELTRFTADGVGPSLPLPPCREGGQADSSSLPRRERGQGSRSPLPRKEGGLEGRPEPVYGLDLGLLGNVRVATRYPNLTRAYFRQRGVPIEIVHLSGSIELAPSIGLADLVVDVVETGRTLRENGLVELTEVARCQATTVVNRVAHRLRRTEIRQLLAAMRNAGGAA